MPRTSSPLNPQRSSSPTPLLSSPTPGATPQLHFGASSYAAQRALPPPPRTQRRAGSLTTPTSHASSSTATARPLSARYARTTPASSLSARRPSGRLSLALPPPPAPLDLFGAGPTPTEGAMWRDRLQRRMADRERRKRARDGAIARRRGTDVALMSDGMDEDEDEADRQAQADDEEFFRRLMVVQRRREQHAQLVSYEVSTGGSDPLLPDFWEEELDNLAREERALISHLDATETASNHSHVSTDPMEVHNEELEQWARDAAAAEAEEAEMAVMVEMEMARYAPAGGGSGGYDAGMEEFTADEWAAITAMDEDEAMDVE